MLIQPITNNALLENYQELLDVIMSKDPIDDHQKMAKVRNHLSEHCVPDIKNVFFIDSKTPPKEVWKALFDKFGPTNTT